MLILEAIIKISQIVTKKSLQESLEMSLGEKFKENPEIKKLNYKALKIE